MLSCSFYKDVHLLVFLLHHYVLSVESQLTVLVCLVFDLVTTYIFYQVYTCNPCWETNGWNAVSFWPSWWAVLNGAAGQSKAAGCWNKDNGHYLLTTCHSCQMSDDPPWQLHSASPPMLHPAERRMNRAFYSLIASLSNINQQGFGGDCSFSFCNRPFKIHPHKVVPTYLHTLHSKMPDDSVKPRKGTKENPSGLLQGINGWVWGMRSLKRKMNHSNGRSLI